MAEARSSSRPLATISITAANGISFSIDPIRISSFLLTRAKRSITRRSWLLYNGVRSLSWPCNPLFPAFVVVFALIWDQIIPSAKLGPLFLLVLPARARAAAGGSTVLAMTMAAVVAVMAAALVQRLALRVLLGYHGWLSEARGRTSVWTTLWAGSLRLLSWSRPLTSSFDTVLPALPVPSLADTMDRWLLSVKPLLGPEDYANAEARARAFAREEGPRLQRWLTLKWLTSENYISDWWVDLVYLRGRGPIAIGSNYYGLDGAYGVPTTSQAARAARIAAEALAFKTMLAQDKLEPMKLQGLVPIAMDQYTRLFGTTRIPGVEADELVHDASARHIAVLSRGVWYTVTLYNDGEDGDGRPASAADLEAVMEEILKDSSLHPASRGEALVAAGTGTDRPAWAKLRSSLLATCGDSLSAIERALFCIVLDEARPASLTEQGKLLLHGDGDTRYFDKSVSFVVFANGRAGLNAEHSFADAPVIAHLWETIGVTEWQPGKYGPDGRNVRPAGNSSSSTSNQVVWGRLAWSGFSPETLAGLEAARDSLRAKAADLHLRVFQAARGRAFGKDDIKRMGVSPDGFVQMALALAYFWDSGGGHALTYESSMTRLFKRGRTETVRAFTSEAKEFVLLAAGGPDRQATRAAFERACANHQQLSRKAMVGEGVDRHMFALYVVSKGKNIPSPFLQEALSMPWMLSTSQQPQVQTNLWDPDRNPKDAQMISPGGGFGPVADDGYGVSYMITAKAIFFHVSSLRSSARTDSDRFAENLERALDLIRGLF